MRFPRTIGFRITLGFGLIIIAIIINVVLSQRIVSRIQSGEGLVGRCVQEGSTIFLTEIPKDYIKIKSGLGQDNPKSLLIGAIEIASLEIIQDFQIEFVERIGSTIASSLSGEHAGSSQTKNPA